MSVAIQVKQLTKHYRIYDKPQDRLKQALFRGKKNFFKHFPALEQVSFSVGKGEIIGVIGRNGSGKSTLLQLLCGTLQATSGEIKITGKIAALLELGSGFNHEFSGRENVKMNAALLGLTQQEITQRFAEIEAFADIGDYIDQPVKTYSTGMVVRLAFAVTVCVNPDILIIDEALSVGDMAFQVKCFDRLEQLIERGTTILLVSHDMQLIKNFCHQVIYLENGALKHIGFAEEVTESYIMKMRNEQNDTHQGLKIEEKIVAKGRKSFGSKEGIIEQVILSSHEQRLIKTGDAVSLQVVAKVSASIKIPQIAFMLRDNKGYNLFGLAILMDKMERLDEQHLRAHFDFIARLTPADYTFTIRLLDCVSDNVNRLIDKQIGVNPMTIIGSEQAFLGVVDLRDTQ